MKSIAIPKFSDRYQALVDAERQYVVDNQHQAKRAGRRDSKGVVAGLAGAAASDSGIEAAFRLVRTQNRADKNNKDAPAST